MQNRICGSNVEPRARVSPCEPIASFASVVCLLMAAALLAGCASEGGQSALRRSSAALAKGSLGRYPGLKSRASQPGITSSILKSGKHRLIDFADIFEVGAGWGWGLGAQASAGVASIGAQKGSYTWLGVFGADQIGVVNDDNFQSVGLPYSALYSARTLMSSAAPLGARLVGAGVILPGFEDGIGGPNGQTSGYESLGPMGYAVGGDSWRSSSFPLGVSTELGPVALVARVRMGALANFMTGFLGFHLFSDPKLY